MKIARSILWGLLLTWLPTGICAQEAPNVGAEAVQGDGETLNDFLNRTTIPKERRSAAAAATEEAVKTGVRDDLARRPIGTATASSFADRVNDSLQNFLPLFQGAIEAVDTNEDSKGVTLRLVPIKTEYGDLAWAATIHEPEPSKALLDSFADDEREALERTIKDRLEDFDDVTWNVTYGYVRPHIDRLLENGEVTTLFGRRPRLYEQVFAQLTGEAFAAALPLTQTEGKELSDLEERVSRKTGAVSIDSVIGRGLRDSLGEDYDRFIELRTRQREKIPDLSKAVAKSSDRLADLIENQPQITITGSYRDRLNLVGQDTWSASISVEVPADPNVNRLLRERKRAEERGDANPWTTALAQLSSGDEAKQAAKGTKWSLSATYVDRRVDSGSLDLRGEGEEPVVIDLPGSHDLCGKLLWSRAATWQAIEIEGDEVFPKILASLEYVDVTGDPNRRDRWLGTLTYDLPISPALTIPLSLTYSNHARFLPEGGDEFGGHFSLSYSFDQPGK